MNYVAECMKKFRSLPREIQELVGGMEAYKKILLLEKKYSVQLGFLVVLVTIGELLLPDIQEYLIKKNKIKKEKAKQIYEELMEKVLLPAIRLVFPEIFEKTKQIDLLQEKNMVREIFESKIVSTLQRNAKSLKELNIRINYALYKEPDFEADLVKAFQNNSEKLTHKEFKLDGKPVSPSVANWLKDFIKKQGGGMFDNVALSRYLINSENTKHLDEAEKNLVRKLLVLYRNLRFFLEVTEHLPMEKWQIFPYEEEKEAFAKARLAPIPRTPAEKDADELRTLAATYPEGSLERKAVEEEARKLVR
jgi:hypothetical protein